MVLDDLYGTSLYIDSSKRGNEHIVTLNVETVNDQYLSEEGVLEKVLNLMYIVLFKPNLENGLFKETIFNREKEAVKQRIESILMRKRDMHSSACWNWHCQNIQLRFRQMARLKKWNA
ncbi:hypothetical protein [Planococcus glaciei]|uniref:hypothetical protein n=1 Tax=Planococcus glaciei TaxID=459472 RepID=UPI003CCDA56E